MLYISPEALLLQDLFKFYSSEYSLFWYMFYVHLERLYIQLLFGSIFYKC